MGSDVSLSPAVTHIVAAWTEALFYGVYTCLFVQACYIMTRKRTENVSSGRVFGIMMFYMYTLSTVHIGLSLYKVLRAYVWRIETPEIYFLDARRWETLSQSILGCVMILSGDALVIYRCWVVWCYNYWVIVLPLVLLMLEFTFYTISLVWFAHPTLVAYGFASSWIYPLLFVQNVITTGTLGWKIWTQSRSSAANGVVDTSSRLSLSRVLRILVESAAIYTIQLFFLLILYPFRNDVQFILQAVMVPSIGIVFVLIAIRIHFTKSRTINDSVALEEIPTWFTEDAPAHLPRSTQDGLRPGQLEVEKYTCTDLAPSQDTLLNQV